MLTHGLELREIDIAVDYKKYGRGGKMGEFIVLYALEHEKCMMRV
jgi:hypothetical protein